MKFGYISEIYMNHTGICLKYIWNKSIIAFSPIRFAGYVLTLNVESLTSYVLQALRKTV